MPSNLIQYVWMSCFFGLSSAIVCYDCRADDSTCNVGQCHGMSCLKMETSNMDNDRRTVHKSCSDEPEPTQCKQSGFGSKLITRCTCAVDYCNRDDLLRAAGLWTSSSARLVTSFTRYLIYFLASSTLLNKFISDLFRITV